MTHQTSDDDARQITCPTCQSKPGIPCTQPTSTGRTHVTWVHAARTDAATGWH